MVKLSPPRLLVFETRCRIKGGEIYLLRNVLMSDAERMENAIGLAVKLSDDNDNGIDDMISEFEVD